MKRRQQSIDLALRVLLINAMRQRPIVSDGSPLTSEHAARVYEIPEREVERVFDQLVKAEIAVKTNSGYLLVEQL